MTTTKIALLGGTGRVGGWVLESCLEQGYHVTALCRSESKVSHLVEKYGKDSSGDGGKLVIVEGDATKEESIQKLLDAAEVDVIISTLGSPSNTTLVVEPAAKALTSVLKTMNKVPRIIWMTSTGINEATEQAMMYTMFGKPASKWFFGYGFFGWLQFKLLIPYVIGQDLWDDMGKSELCFLEAAEEIKNKTVLLRPTNMHPVSETKVFSEEWRNEGGKNLKYLLVKASDPPPGKWMVRKAISQCIIDLITDTKYDGTAMSLFQDGVAE